MLIVAWQSLAVAGEGDSRAQAALPGSPLSLFLIPGRFRGGAGEEILLRM